MITFSIVIYKNYNDVKRLLSSLYLINYEKKIILIDNSPYNIFKSYVQNEKDIIYIWNADNIGFGAGHNCALKLFGELNSKYHVILNPDIYFDYDIFPDLLKYFTPDVGIMTPKILYSNHELQFNCRLIPSAKTLILRRIPFFKKFIESYKRKEELRFTNYDNIMEVPFIIGCFMIFDTSLFKKIGGFDERFFMYLEDVDICRRVLVANKKILFVPFSTVYHGYAKGSQKDLKLLFIHIVSKIKYFNKWGWFFDRERKRINSNCLKRLNF